MTVLSSTAIRTALSDPERRVDREPCTQQLLTATRGDQGHFVGGQSIFGGPYLGVSLPPIASASSKA